MKGRNNKKSVGQVGRRDLLRWGAAAALGWPVVRCRSVPPPGTEAASARWVEEQLGQLSLTEKVGQLICVASRVEGLESLMQSGKAGSVFVPRGLSPEELIAVRNQYQELSRFPLLIIGGGIDNGLGNFMVKGATSMPRSMAIGATRSKEMAYQAGRIMALEARAMGIHWPGPGSCDVNTNPDNPIINTRSFGDSPELVAELHTALVKGLQDQHTIAWAYHFPGHGDTGEDSHAELPVIRHDLDRLRSVDLAPFKALIEAGVKSICTAHIWYPALEPTEGLPATLSKRILTDLLRKELGYQGVISSDAMSMQGILDDFDVAEASLMAFQAGVDILLAYPETERCFQTLLEAIEDSAELQVRLEESVRRVLELKAWAGLDREQPITPGQTEQTVGTAEHREAALEIVRKAVMVIQGEGFIQALPTRSKLLFVIGEGRKWLTGEWSHQKLISGLKERFPQGLFLEISSEATGEERQKVMQEAQKAEVVVAGVFTNIGTRDASSTRISGGQAELLHALIKTRPTGVFCYGSPYVLRPFGAAEALVCSYDASRPSVEAGVELCSGQIAAVGKLPVRLKI